MYPMTLWQRRELVDWFFLHQKVPPINNPEIFEEFFMKDLNFEEILMKDLKK